MARSALSQREVAAVLDASESFLEVGSIEELRQCAVDTVAALLRRPWCRGTRWI
jgi:hypothetical protein